MVGIWEIAVRPGVTTVTVRQHLKNCCARFHVRTRTEAAMKLRAG